MEKESGQKPVLAMANKILKCLRTWRGYYTEELHNEISYSSTFQLSNATEGEATKEHHELAALVCTNIDHTVPNLC